MNIDLKSKPIVISFVFGALILALALVYVGFRLVSKTSQKANPSAKTPVVKTEKGNPRAIVTDAKKYSEEAKRAIKDATPSTPATVTISDSAFVPAEVKVKAPYVVTFKNAGKSAHSVKGVSGKWGSLKDLEPGEAYSQQFDVPGTYGYFDPLNPTMKGTVVVE